MARPKLRTSELRERVLERAATIVETDGVVALTARRLAAEASTSVGAVYELCGDKEGILRALLFDGFAQLADTLEAVAEGPDPEAELRALLGGFRHFGVSHGHLVQLMFGRAVAAFDPGRDERAASDRVRTRVVATVSRLLHRPVDAPAVVDAAHVALALAQGLVVQEAAGWLGSTQASIDRRWELGVDLLLRGLRSRSGR